MVDAAICIPLFIIAVAMMLQVINFCIKEEQLYYDAEKRIQTVGLFGGRLELGNDVDDPERGIFIDHVQRHPIIYKASFPFNGAFRRNKYVIMDMPYRTFIGESPDKYSGKNVYIFPKNEGNEKSSPKYHSTNCRIIKGGITKGLQMETVSEEDAKSRGYSICSWCIREMQDKIR